MRYSFACQCGKEVEIDTPLSGFPYVVLCPRSGDFMSRVYKAQGLFGGAELRRERNARLGGRRYLREQAKIESKEIAKGAPDR